MKLPDKVYDVLKWVVQVVLPAVATLYLALSGIWGLPYPERVVGSITAVNTFLGVIIGVSSANYPGHGTLEIDTTDPDKDTYLLNLSTPLEDLPKKDKIVLNVSPSATFVTDSPNT